MLYYISHYPHMIHHYIATFILIYLQLPGDRDADEVFYDIANIMDVAFYGRKPGYYIHKYPPLEHIIRDVAVGSAESSKAHLLHSSSRFWQRISLILLSRFWFL